MKKIKDFKGKEINPGDLLEVMGKRAKAIIFEGEFGYTMLDRDDFTFDPFTEDSIWIERTIVIQAATSTQPNQD
jgi:hypothetical protein